MLIPLSAIAVQDGFNPRFHFDEAGLADLRRSLSEQGQIAPITVRPNPEQEGRYLLVAGERRFRCMTELGWTEAKADVIKVSERDARMIALEENLVRAGLTPADEARYLRSLLDAFDGDRAEVGRRLGWSASKMASRLALLHASNEVLDELAKGRILLGHAELLAALPTDMQSKPLARILADGLTVADVREALSTAAIPLEHAIFDKTACALCPSNSAVQASLFTESIGEGKCSNRVCFTAKSNAALAVIRAEMEERVAVVALASERDKGTTAPVSEAKVGCGAWTGCLSCARFGAVITDQLGPECGKVEQSVCFDIPCLEQKVAANAAALKAAVTLPTVAADDAGQGDDGMDDAQGEDGLQDADEAGGVVAATPTRTAATKPAVVATSKALRTAVKDHFDAVLRRAAVSVFESSPEACLSVVCLALDRFLKESGVPSPLSEEPGTYGGLSPAQVVALSQEDQATLLGKLMAGARAFMASPPKEVDRFDRKKLAALLTSNRGVPLAPHVVVDEALLKSLTLAEITAWLDTSGFKARVLASTDGKAKWARLIKLGKGELVKAIVASGFAFADFEPPGLADYAAHFAD